MTSDRSKYDSITWPGPHTVKNLPTSQGDRRHCICCNCLLDEATNAIKPHFYSPPYCSCANCVWLSFTLRAIPRNVPLLLDREVSLGKRKSSKDAGESMDDGSGTPSLTNTVSSYIPADIELRIPQLAQFGEILINGKNVCEFTLAPRAQQCHILPKEAQQYEDLVGTQIVLFFISAHSFASLDDQMGQVLRLLSRKTKRTQPIQHHAL
jgi:hypothetical protein